MICALGLAFSPVAASSAQAPASDMAGCTMGGEMPDMPAGHSNMDCCTPACQAPSTAAALLPRQDSGLSDYADKKLKLACAPAKELTSIQGAGLDPPPRA